MSLSELASKYIGSAEHVFSNIEVSKTQITLDSIQVSRVTEFARAYMEDAKYYRERQKFEVSLTSIAYCEGLLDALRILGAVKFEWPDRNKREKRSGK